MIEVELKFELSPTSWPQLTERLATMQLKHRLMNSDIYYDTADFNLLRQAVFVRVRNHSHLEFKFNEQADLAHNKCTEYSFPLRPDARQAAGMNALFSRFMPHWRSASTVEEALYKNNLIILAYIENRRVQYAHDDLVVCVDRVAGLGNFLEIEIQCAEEDDTSLAEGKVRSFASGLTARQVWIGYVELWLKKHHPQAYLKGKYHE